MRVHCVSFTCPSVSGALAVIILLLWTSVCKHLFKSILSVLLGVHPGNFLNSVFNLLRKHYTVFHSSFVICSPTTNVQVFSFVTSSATRALLSFLDDKDPNEREVVFYCGGFYLFLLFYVCLGGFVCLIDCYMSSWNSNWPALTI